MNKITKKLIFLLIVTISLCGEIIGETINENKEQNFYGIPIIFGSSDVGVGYGAQLIYLERSDSSVLDGELQGIITTKDQMSLSFDVQKELKESGYILEFSSSAVEWKSPFYGIGNNSDEDAEELYVSKEFGFTTGFKRELMQYQYIGTKYIFRDLETTEIEEGGLLDTGDYNENGKVSGLGISYSIDKRDNSRNTKNGYLVSSEGKLYNSSFGSDYDFDTVLLDARAYKQLEIGRILALQFYTAQSTGTVPLDYLESLGSSTLLRGYLSKRYVDKSKLAMQGEYRFPIYGKFTGGAFASSGQVANRISDFELNEMKATIGAGIKYIISERDGVKVRLDFGINEDGSMAFYLDFGDAL